MECTTIIVPPGQDQTAELRRLVAVAQDLGFEWAVWPGPVGSADMTFHAWGDRPCLDKMRAGDPIRASIESYRYLFEDEAQRLADALPQGVTDI